MKKFGALLVALQFHLAQQKFCIHTADKALKTSDAKQNFYKQFQQLFHKHIPFDDLGTEIVERVKALYLTGETAERIRQAVLDTPGYNRLTLPIFVIDDFKEAVLKAAESAQEGDVVILSPACSSFDKFKNFVERGNTFREIVLSLE